MSVLDRRTPDIDVGNEIVHQRMRWGIYSATIAAAFFIVGLVMLWQLAIASVLAIAAPFEGMVIAMFAIAGLCVIGAVGLFASAAPHTGAS